MTNHIVMEIEKEIFNKIYNLTLPFIVKMMYDFSIKTI